MKKQEEQAKALEMVFFAIYQAETIKKAISL